MMRFVFWLIALLAMEPLMAADSPLQEGQHPQPAAAPGDYAYQLFLPRGYLASGKQQWPLMIFLHGSGERGADIDLVKVNGPPKMVEDHPGFLSSSYPRRSSRRAIGISRSSIGCSSTSAK